MGDSLKYAEMKEKQIVIFGSIPLERALHSYEKGFLRLPRNINLQTYTRYKGGVRQLPLLASPHFTLSNNSMHQKETQSQA